MKVGIQSLKGGLNAFTFDVDVADIEFDDENFELVQVNVRSKVDKNEQSVVVTSDVTSIIKLTCDACLESFSGTFEDSYVLLYASDKDAMEPDDEVRLISSGTQFIDLTEGLRESILVSLPIRFKCSDNCKGLCDQCGCNLNTSQCSCGKESTDPRWDQLKGLLGQDRPSS